MSRDPECKRAKVRTSYLRTSYKLSHTYSVFEQTCEKRSGGENEEQLFIHEMQNGDPFKMNNFVNNFIDSPPFGLYDIFNYLIYHSTSLTSLSKITGCSKMDTWSLC